MIRFLTRVLIAVVSFTFLFSVSIKIGATVTELGGGVPWTNITNAQSENGVFATSVGIDDLFNRIQITNFGFSIPVGSSIDAIYDSVKIKSTDVGSNEDELLSIISGVTGNNDASGIHFTSINIWQQLNNDPVSTYEHTWTVAEINASNSGFELSIFGALGETVSIDAFKRTVQYTSAGGIHKRVIGYGHAQKVNY